MPSPQYSSAQILPNKQYLTHTHKKGGRAGDKSYKQMICRWSVE